MYKSIPKIIALFALVLMGKIPLFAQRKMEKLDRGVVAIRTSPTSVYVGWRLLGDDTEGVSFNVYRGATKINPTPISATTNIVDAVATDAIYTVRPVVNGLEKAASKATAVLSKPYIGGRGAVLGQCSASGKHRETQYRCDAQCSNHENLLGGLARGVST